MPLGTRSPLAEVWERFCLCLVPTFSLSVSPGKIWCLLQSLPPCLEPWRWQLTPGLHQALPSSTSGGIKKKNTLASICHISLRAKYNSRDTQCQHEFHLLTEPILLTKTALELCLCCATVAKFLSTDKAEFPALPGMGSACAAPGAAWEPLPLLSLAWFLCSLAFQRGEPTSDGSIQEKTFHTKGFISHFVSAKSCLSCNFTN